MSEINEWAIENCEVPMTRFCGKREERQNCALPRCCSICPKNDYCENVCDILTASFPHLINEKED